MKTALLPRTVACAAFAFVVFSTLPSFAQGTAQQRAACTGDAFRFCISDIPDAGRIEACLIQHMSRLTPACQAQFEPQVVQSPAGSVRSGESQ